MADVTIAGSRTVSSQDAHRAGPFWTSPTVGYHIYIDAASDLKYKKTINGGATWGAAVNIRTGTIFSYDCWADWQTPGDAGIKIHIAYIDKATDDIRYVNIDTSDGSINGDDLIEACLGTGTMSGSSGLINVLISITKTVGGNIAVAFRYKDSNVISYRRFFTSPDADTWTLKDSPWEANDYMLLFPANLADNQDLWAAYWDLSANAISIKTFDDSADNWFERAVSAGMVESATYFQMDGAIRISDGHLILVAWSEFDAATADLKVWDATDADNIAAKTNVITDTAEYIQVSVFIDHLTDDIYVSYLGGTVAQSEIQARYKKSDDGGGTWGGDTVLQADAEDDERWISAGAINAAWGGKFQPIWYNEDLFDLFTNSDNGISIPAAAPEEEPKHTFRLHPRPGHRMEFHPNLKLG